MSEEMRNFSRDTDAAIRLYLQHWIFHFETGFLLHPKITVQPNARIIDVGCGTGLWLSDLARTYPDAQLDGFDLSSAHFPPSGDLPRNVRLFRHDATEPVPFELAGKYDVVHVARLHMYIGDAQFLTVVENFRSLLKPGGYIQWDELDVPGMHAASRDDSRSYPAFERQHRLTKSWLQSQRTTSGSLDDIPLELESSGFRMIQHKRWEVSKVMSKPWTDMQLIANRDYLENIIIPMADKIPTLPKADDLRSLRLEVEKEVMQQGLRILMDMTYTVAQKC